MQSELFDSLCGVALRSILYDSEETLDLIRNRSFSNTSTSSRRSGSQEPRLSKAVSDLRCSDPLTFLKHKSPLVVKEIEERLSLTHQKADGVYLQFKNLEELKREKSILKQELCLYDSEFKRDIGRDPTDQEKQPMRNCYLYYKRIKTAIDRYDPSKKPALNDGLRAELVARLEKAAVEKKRLNKLIISYKTNFEASYGRPITYSKDLQPIKKEYNTYLELKKEIAEIRAKLQMY